MTKQLSALLLVLFCFGLSFSQSRSERKQEKKERTEREYQSVKKLIESKQFQFVANWATPLDNTVSLIGQRLPGGNMVFQGNRINMIGNTNFLNLNMNNANIYLPYFGRVLFPRNYGAGSGGAIEFKGEIEDIDIKYNDKKHRVTITFNANKQDDDLQFNLQVNTGGSAFLTVQSINRQSINYYGKLSEYKPATTSSENN